jgi:hypothetical protein
MSFILLDLYLVLLVIMSIYGFYIYEIITIYVFILMLYWGHKLQPPCEVGYNNPTEHVVNPLSYPQSTCVEKI